MLTRFFGILSARVWTPDVSLSLFWSSAYPQLASGIYISGRSNPHAPPRHRFERAIMPLLNYYTSAVKHLFAFGLKNIVVPITSGRLGHAPLRHTQAPPPPPFTTTAATAT